MRLIAQVLMVFSLILAASNAPAVQVEVSDKKPLLSIIGVIGNQNIIPVGQELLRLANEGKKEAQLIINSPGGEVTTGLLYLSLMDAARAKGLKVTCFVPQVAASMAFQILLHCDERHVLDSSFLLWHRARVRLGGGFMSPGVVVTAPEALRLGKDLDLLDSFIYSELKKYMPEVKERELSFHFEAETLHIGLNLHKMAPHFVTPHGNIPGLFDTLIKEVNKKKAKGEEEMSIDSFDNGDMIYISERVMQEMSNTTTSKGK